MLGKKDIKNEMMLFFNVYVISKDVLLYNYLFKFRYVNGW